MLRSAIFILLLILTSEIYSQKNYIDHFINDTSMANASVSLMIIDTESGMPVAEFDEDRCLTQASVMKLVTAAAALELLGPEYTFKTELLISGRLKNKKLTGDIIIKGGGDPALGSERFQEHYGDIINKWAGELIKLGIRKIGGKVKTDDSRYDYQPVPQGWIWEDIGNYYGAGAYGLSIFDNKLDILLKAGGEGTIPVITGIKPSITGISYTNYLLASGSRDQGYIYSAPYSRGGWILGTIPVNSDDFILKASVPDPPLAAAELLDAELRKNGFKITSSPATTRMTGYDGSPDYQLVMVTESPELTGIAEMMNHESVNLYAEHLVKELGLVFKGSGTTSSGLQVISEFLDTLGIAGSGLFIEDGSGLSPKDALSSKCLASLLYIMKKKGRYFDHFYNSLPEAGSEGTLKNYFRDSVFKSVLRAKSGTMTRVKSYAGYVTTRSGKELAFSIIVNNFTGSSAEITKRIEALLKEVILTE